jgi:hypothetical protein
VESAGIASPPGNHYERGTSVYAVVLDKDHVLFVEKAVQLFGLHSVLDI